MYQYTLLIKGLNLNEFFKLNNIFNVYTCVEIYCFNAEHVVKKTSN